MKKTRAPLGLCSRLMDPEVMHMREVKAIEIPGKVHFG